MGIKKTFSFENDDNEKKIFCSYCGKHMYKLEGSLSESFVCSSCGRTIELKDMPNNINENRKNGPLIENLFKNEFMKKYTKFDSFDEFIKNCSLIEIDDINSLNQILNKGMMKKWDQYVQNHTKFSSWDEMFERAIESYLHM